MANSQTIKIAAEEGEIMPIEEFVNSNVIKIGSIEVENRFFGGGHTEDNIVSYVKADQVLFGGCMIKSLNAPKR